MTKSAWLDLLRSMPVRLVAGALVTVGAALLYYDSVISAAAAYGVIIVVALIMAVGFIHWEARYFGERQRR